MESHRYEIQAPPEPAASRPHVLARALGLFLLVTVFTLAGCGGADNGEGGDADSTAAVTDSSQAASDTTDAKKNRKPREKTASVNVAEVMRDDLVIPVIAEGVIRAPRSSEIRSEISGRIDRVHVREGQRVRKGQALLTLDDRQYRVALEEAEADYVQALGKLAVEENTASNADAVAELEKRLEELRDMQRRGAITREELETKMLELEVQAVKQGAYRDAIVQVRSGLAKARAAVKRAELDLEHARVTAPFAGVVSDMMLTEGEWLSVQQKLCDVVDNLNIEAEVAVLESDLRSLVVGRPALLQLPALGDTLRVQVDVISPEVDAATRTCQVLMRFKNEDGRARPGMFVRAAIAGESYPDCLLVPREAILTRDGRPLLFRIEKDRAKWVYVTLGRANDRFVEIAKVLQGGPLNPGTQVVVSDHLTLTHDAKVRVKKVQKASPLWSSVESGT